MTVREFVEKLRFDLSRENGWRLGFSFYCGRYGESVDWTLQIDDFNSEPEWMVEEPTLKAIVARYEAARVVDVDRELEAFEEGANDAPD